MMMSSLIKAFTYVAVILRSIYCCYSLSNYVSHQRTAAVISSEEILSNVALKGTIKQGTNEQYGSVYGH